MERGLTVTVTQRYAHIECGLGESNGPLGFAGRAAVECQIVERRYPDAGIAQLRGERDTGL